MRRTIGFCIASLCLGGVVQAEIPFPLFDYLQGKSCSMVAYTPTGLDPRLPGNNVTHPTSELEADLKALRPVFDGLVLYGYHEASTPRIVALAHKLKFRAVILGIWQPKSADEVDGVAALVSQFHDKLALGVLIGNEGIHFGRYEPQDLTLARERLLPQIPDTVPYSTSEPHVQYQKEFLRSFGHFLAPNIHPVFDQPDLEPEDAASWARERAVDLAKQTGKPVVLKETGFPHDGKDNFTPKTQREFWQAYSSKRHVTIGDTWVSFAVAFEAFDLPWKSEASGLPIEKAWGFFSKDRVAYPVVDVWKQASTERN